MKKVIIESLISCLHVAIERIRIANEEGNPILSTWRPAAEKLRQDAAVALMQDEKATSNLNVYTVWGRVPGSYDDTGHVIAADCVGSAQKAFADLLHEEYTENDLDLIYHEHGVTIFINDCVQLGWLVKIDGETLIRPVAGSIFEL